jgi:hypothetical protein
MLEPEFTQDHIMAERIRQIEKAINDLKFGCLHPVACIN